VERRIRLLVCDDHPVVRYGLVGLLRGQKDFEVVAEASNGAEAIELVGCHRPDVVVMDLQMPVVDGATATEGITSSWPETRILILTTFDTDADVLRAVENGAAGFLLKDAPHEDIFAAIREISSDGAPLAPKVAARLIKRMRTEETELLSAREIEILRLVADGRSNREIGQQLWISEATVKSHLNRIYAKLDSTDRTAAVTAALRRGIIRLHP
jgi:DNA-binding NarL/FixJ family response regulator